MDDIANGIAEGGVVPDSISRMSSQYRYNDRNWLVSVVNTKRDTTSPDGSGIPLGHSAIIVEGKRGDGSVFEGYYDILGQRVPMGDNQPIELVAIRYADPEGTSGNDPRTGAEINDAWRERKIKRNEGLNWRNRATHPCRRTDVETMIAMIKAQHQHVARCVNVMLNAGGMLAMSLARNFKLAEYALISSMSTEEYYKGIADRYNVVEFSDLQPVELIQPDDDEFIHFLGTQAHDDGYVPGEICYQEIDEITNLDDAFNQYNTLPIGDLQSQLLVFVRESLTYHYYDRGLDQVTSTYQVASFHDTETRRKAIKAWKSADCSHEGVSRFLFLYDCVANEWSLLTLASSNRIKIMNVPWMLDGEQIKLLNEDLHVPVAFPWTFGEELFSPATLMVMKTTLGVLPEQLCSGDYFRQAQTVLHHDETVNCSRWASTKVKIAGMEVQDKKPQVPSASSCTLL